MFHKERSSPCSYHCSDSQSQPSINLSRVRPSIACSPASKIEPFSLLVDIPVLAPDCLIPLSIVKVAAAADISMIDLDLLRRPDSMASLIIPFAGARRGHHLAFLLARGRGDAAGDRENVLEDADLGAG